MNGIILTDESANAIAKMSDEQAGKIVKALIKREEPEGLDGASSMVYPFIKGQVERLSEIHEKRAKAGAAGGKAKANNKQTFSKPLANAKQNATPYHTIPNHTIPSISRSDKIQKAYGFSTERQNVDYNEIARQLREAAE